MWWEICDECPYGTNCLNGKDVLCTLVRIGAKAILRMFPELKGNEFIKSQIDIVIYNQEKITDLKMNIAELEAYRLWLFMGAKEEEE